MELFINGDALRRTDIFEFGFDFCGMRDFIWWLLSDRRSNLLTASGDCVPKNEKNSFGYFVFFGNNKRQQA